MPRQTMAQVGSPLRLRRALLAALVFWAASPCVRAATEPAADAASAPAAASHVQGAARTAPALESLHFTVACVQLVETSRFPSLHDSGRIVTPATSPALSCPTRSGTDILVGKGQVIALLDATQYDQAVESAAAQNLKATDGPELILNGFQLGKGAKLIAVERSNVKGAGGIPQYVALRYQLVPNDDSEDAWSTLYQEVGLLNTAQLRVAVAWKDMTVFAFDPQGSKLKIAISDGWTLAPAFGICVLVLAFYWWAMYRTDLFRTCSAFPWWEDARQLRVAVMKTLRKNSKWKMQGFEPPGKPTAERATPVQVAPADLAVATAFSPAPGAGVPGVDRLSPPVETRPGPVASSTVSAAAQPEGSEILHAGIAGVDARDNFKLCPKVLELLQNSAWGGPNFTNDQVAACMEQAKLALDGYFPDTELKKSQTIIGLSLHRRPIPVVRATFSLVAVQVGTWVTFACLAAVFLWLVYGQWPMLKGSMLVLVTISAATATASWLVDSSARQFKPSVNLLRDLTAGTDNEQRVHRFQAVMVNALLLFIGTAFVVQHLAYPTFDPSWLEFLGLSGLLQTAGKGLLEKSTPK